MGLFSRLRGKKETKTEVRIITDLERLCGDDKETYEALHNIIILNPKKIGVSMKTASENAKKAEKDKDNTKARMWYRIAGGLAIYEGNAKKAAEFFTECERITPTEKFPFLKNPEKAVAKAQEYYQKYLPS